MSIIDDTGELRHLAEQIHRLEHDPRRPGALDTMLLSITIGSAAVVVACLLLLTFAANNFPVEPGRILLTMAAAGTCVSPVLLGMYGLNRANRKRHEQVMDKLDRIACLRVPASEEVMRTGVGRVVQDVLKAVERRAPETRKLSRSEYWEVYQDVMADLGDLPDPAADD